MFDQERFDGLARGLATNQLSRGQVLKSLAAGMFLGFTGTFGLGRSRVATAAPPLNLKKDRVTANSCEELAAHIEQTGVRTREPGVTTGPPKPNPDRVAATSWTCKVAPNPEHTTAITVDDPEPNRRYCLALTSLTTKFSLPTASFVIDWQPPTPECKDTPTCKAEWNRIVDKAGPHETHHVLDTAYIEEGYPPVKERWTKEKSPYKACGTGANAKQDAIASLRTKINKHLDDLAKKHCPKLDREVEQKEKKFHRTKAGKYPKLDCTKCPSKTECPPEEPGTGGSGSGETCGGKTCETWQVCCNGRCVNTNSDGSNCGTCGNACNPGQTCEQGRCVGDAGCPQQSISEPPCGPGFKCCPQGHCCPECRDCGPNGTCKFHCRCNRFNTNHCVANNGEVFCCKPDQLCCPGSDFDTSACCNPGRDSCRGDGACCTPNGLCHGGPGGS